jgi:hypothetical protein
MTGDVGSDLRYSFLLRGGAAACPEGAKWIVTAVVLACLALACPVRAWPAEPAPAGGTAQPGKGTPTPPLVYRRLYAPADRMEQWPRGGARLVPMPAAEFERLTSIARMAASGSDASIAAAVASARYRAKLVGDVLGEGEASLEIVHTAQGAVMLPLDPCGLAVGKATWSAGESKPAQLGLSADGKLRVLVEQSGKLQLAWSLRGRRDAAGAVDFPLELPPAPSSQLILDLPEKTVPLPEHGLVVKEPGAEKGMARWRIELGGNHRLRLRILPGEDAAGAGQLTRVRQSLDYKFSLHGVDLEDRFQLDVHNEPLRQVAVSMGRELQLVSARCGDAPVAWSVAAPSPDSAAVRVVLEFPEPVEGTGRVLSLVAVAPLRTDARWSLPAIRPQGLFWQEGQVTLAVARPLVLEQLLVHRGRQFRLEPLPPPGQGEKTEIQLFAPDADVEVLLARGRAPVLVDSATSIELTGGQITGRAGASFHLTDGERYQLEADVGRGWTIDSVESVPAGALGDWDVEKQEGAGQKLVVRWTHALSPSRPAQLLASARRLHSPLGQSLSIGELLPLLFHASTGSHRLVAVSAVEPYQVKVSGAEQVSMLNPASLDPSVAKLFVRPPKGLVFENGPAVAGLKISLENPRPPYAAPHSVAATPQASPRLPPAMTDTDGPAAWAWSCRLQSRLDSEGTGRHLAIYRLENSGRRQVAIALPPGVSLEQVRGIWVDGVHAAWRASGGEGKRGPSPSVRSTLQAGTDRRLVPAKGDGPLLPTRVEVELPAGERYPVVGLQYTTHGSPLGLLSRVEPPLPTLDVPVLARQWTVWIPPGYEPGDPDPQWQTPRDEPLTWSQRLLGPLGQPATHWPFDPGRVSDWAALVDAQYPAPAVAKAAKLIDRIGALSVAGQRERAGDWGSLLRAPAVLGPFSGNATTVHRLALLVDGEALQRLGVTPRTPIAETRSGGVATLDGAAILDQAGLALLVHTDAVVLTSADEVALDRGQLAPLAEGVGWQVLPGPLSELIHLAATAEKEPDGSLPIPAPAWTQLHGQAQIPWSAPRLGGYQPGDTLGWRACRLEISDRRPVHLTVVRRSALEVFRWAMFLAVAAAVFWWGAGRAARIVALAGLLAAAALLLPGTVATIVSGALLGALLGLAFQWVRLRPAAAANGSGRTRKARSAVSTLTHVATQLGPDAEVT